MKTLLVERDRQLEVLVTVTFNRPFSGANAEGAPVLRGGIAVISEA